MCIVDERIADMNNLGGNRQGVLPYTQFWVSTKPFGTPIGPYLLKWVVTIIFIIAPPAGDAFQFGKSFPHTGLGRLLMSVEFD
jgi:hypothetical protein